jgi:hypothetical protein
MDVHAPELPTHQTLPQFFKVRLTQKPRIKRESIIVDLILQLISDQIWQVVVPVDEWDLAENVAGSRRVVRGINRVAGE